jgi:hypothetical protein
MKVFNELEQLLNERSEKLQWIIKEKEYALKKAPEGLLRVTKCRTTTQYFVRTDSCDFNGKYIKQKDKELACRLAQKEYDLKVLDKAKKELLGINNILNTYSKGTFEKAIHELSRGKADLVVPIQLSDEEFIAEWMNQSIERPYYHVENAKYDNGNGVMMRSKSEVMIANLLDKMGIPYIYEKPLKLSATKTVMPDFTLLDMRYRKEVYLEHLGMMDDMDYVMRNMEKIKEYQQHGYYLGRQLLVTYETSIEPIDIGQVKKMLEEYL